MEPSLPLDVQYCIIDHLWDDKSTLAICTHVCHAWLHPARVHLFDTIQVMAPVLDTFLAFLDAHSEVRPYIKALHLLHRRGMRGLLSTPELAIEDLSAILSLLSGVRTLHLQHMYLRGRRDASTQFPRRFCLDKLWVDNCSRAVPHEDSLVDIMDFVCLFECIGSFKLGMCYWVKPGHVPSASWQPPRETVDIDQFSAEVNELWWDEAAMMLGKLIGRSPGPRTLSFRCGCHWIDVCTTGNLLGLIGIHVRRLTLNFSWLYLRDPPSTAQVTSAISLTRLSQLEHVHFVIYVEDFKETSGPGWRCSQVCADILSSATRLPDLTTIALTLEVPNDRPAALSEYAVDWTRIDESLRGLPALGRVDVLFRCLIDEATSADDWAVQIVRQGLSVTAAKQILNVNIEYGCRDLLD